MGFTPDTLERFSRQLVNSLVREATPVALSVIPSEQLREKLTPRVHSPTAGDLFLTPYWALFVHDGHGVIAPTRAKFLVYYADRQDDPRRPGGQSPDRLVDERRLTKREFTSGLAENRRRQQTNPSGGPNQFMIVVSNADGSPGKSGPARGTPFFETLMAPFEDSAEDLIYNHLEAYVLRQLFDEDAPGERKPIIFEF